MMKRKRSLFLCLSSLFVLVIVLAGCGGGGGGGTTPSAEMATISGVITGSSPNLLIPGAMVTAAGGGRTFTTVSGPDGRYTLHLPPAAYTLTAAKETFNEATAVIEVATGAAVTRDFALVTGSGGTPSLPQDFQTEYHIYTGPAELDFRSMAKLMKNRQAPAYPPLAATRQPSGEYVYGLEIYGEIGLFEILPSGAVGIRVYAGDAADGPFVLIDSVPFRESSGSSWIDFYHTDPELSPEHGKYYALSVYGTSGETSLTEPVEIVPLPPCVLASPANGEECQSRRPTLSWNEIPNADSFSLSLMFSGGGLLIPLDGTVTQWTPENDLQPGVYIWGIRAEKCDYEADWYWYSYSYSRTFTIQ